MIIIGIDMSKNSPGVCIREDDKLTFHSFIRGREIVKPRTANQKRTVAHFEDLIKLGVKVTYNERSTDIKEYSELEIWKISDASQLAETIVSSLPDSVDIIGMEGFSYGSKGNSGLDIAGYAYCVRKAIYEKYGSEKMCIFSPGNVKKVAGKGNAGKEEIMNFFINCKDKDLIENEFWKAISSKKITNEKPVDDLIDSYYIQEC